MKNYVITLFTGLGFVLGEAACFYFSRCLALARFEPVSFRMQPVFVLVATLAVTSFVQEARRLKEEAAKNKDDRDSKGP